MRSLPPQLSFADLELQFQGVQLDPLLRTIAEFLDQHLTLIEQVRKDLERGLKNPRTADLHEKLPDGVQGFPNRTRSARRRMQTIQRMTAAERSQQQEPKYRELIGITEQVVNNARQVVEKAKAAAAGAGDLIASLGIDSLRNEITGYCQLAERVIDQSRRRVLQGEKVPTEEKIYSIFEPHTDLIKRGKAQKPVELGHKVFLAESAQGLITDYQVLDGNPSDTDHVQSSLNHHKQTFGNPPELYATDRGFFSAENVQY